MIACATRLEAMCFTSSHLAILKLISSSSTGDEPLVDGNRKVLAVSFAKCSAYSRTSD